MDLSRLDLLKTFSKLLNRNPYKPLSKKEIEDQSIIEKQVKQDIVEFAKVAKELFQDQRYEKLRKQFQKITSETMRLLVHFDSPDNTVYCNKMRNYQRQLKYLIDIFDTPQGFINEASKILRGEDGRYSG